MTNIKRILIISSSVIFGLVLFSSFRAKFKSSSYFTIVNNGRSNYSILLPESPSQSVLIAARELQLDLKLATGAELPLIESAAFRGGHYISLGSTIQALKLGFNSEHIDLEGFYILSRDENVYILGPDSPDNHWTAMGGKSEGTANGVYTFLEDYLNVRWLMPGDLGRVVPSMRRFDFYDVNRKEVPKFFARRMPFMQNREPSVIQWEAFQKLGASVNVIQRPTWKQNVPDSMFATHPEWFPLIKGKRTIDMHNYKLETTNPFLIRRFADNAIQTLQEHPEQYTVSLSPTDFPNGWSESDESRAFYDERRWGYQMTTTLMLKFYHDVSEILAKEYPNGRLAGYLYDVYKSPPTNPESYHYLPLPANFYPTLANNGDYGYRLYQENNKKLMEELLAFWTKQSTQITYYGIPNRHDNTSGVILPPATALLNFSFNMLTKYSIKGVLMYGNTTWSEGALGNYIIAKMMWNPQLNADTLQKEWLDDAYGVESGQIMNLFYHKLEDWYHQYYQTKPSGYLYHLSDPLLRAVFANHYIEMEHAFLMAKQKLQTAQQKARFQLLEDNLILLQATLRRKNMLMDDFKSPFQRNEEELQKILEKPYSDFQLFPKRIP